MTIRTALGSLALFVCSIIFTLLTVEALFRIVGVSIGTGHLSRRLVTRSTNPRLLYELRPNASAHAKVHYRTNSHGMRNREVDESKPPGTLRIAVVGDSIAFGWWIDEASLFSSQLESLLNPAGSGRTEVLNFGVPGYNLEQETEHLRSNVLRFSPDIVIVAFCLNDMQAFSNQYGRVLDRTMMRSTLAGRLTDWLLEHSIVLAWIDHRKALLETRHRIARDRSPLKELAAELDEQRRELSKSFAAFADAVGGASIPGLVSVFPLFSVRFSDYPYRDAHRAVVDSSRAAGLHAVDLLPCFSAYDLRDVRVDDVHPSPLGHRVAAHAVLDALSELDLVDGSGLNRGESERARAMHRPSSLASAAIDRPASPRPAPLLSAPARAGPPGRPPSCPPALGSPAPDSPER